MFIDAHFQCDRAGCNNQVPATHETVPEPKFSKTLFWYRLIVSNSKGQKLYDFCSLDCLAKRIKIGDLNGLE